MPEHKELARRAFFSKSGQLTLSAAAISLLGGGNAFAHSSASSILDVEILNVALALEHEAIGAYQLGAGSGLLTKPTLDTAIQFQSHHKTHRDALAATIDRIGGQAVKEKSLEEYAKSLKASTLKNQADVLALAAKLELGAANAYLGVIPSFKDINLSQVAARLAADEVMHWTVLSQALGNPLPASAFSFGS